MVAFLGAYVLNYFSDSVAMSAYCINKKIHLQNVFNITVAELPSCVNVFMLICVIPMLNHVSNMSRNTFVTSFIMSVAVWLGGIVLLYVEGG